MAVDYAAAGVPAVAEAAGYAVPVAGAGVVAGAAG